MKKYILRGPNINTQYSENEKVKMIQGGQDFYNFLLPAENKRPRSEIILDAHGKGGDKTFLTFYSPRDKERSEEIEAKDIINKIVYNTIAGDVNIIHAFSCHAEDIHKDLSEIEGNIILFTHNPNYDVMWDKDAISFYNSRVNNKKKYNRLYC